MSEQDKPATKARGEEEIAKDYTRSCLEALSFADSGSLLEEEIVYRHIVSAVKETAAHNSATATKDSSLSETPPASDQSYREGFEAEKDRWMAQVRAELATGFEADKKRLDWLSGNTVSICDHPPSCRQGDIYVNGNQYRERTLREAIDAAMSAVEANTVSEKKA